LTNPAEDFSAALGGSGETREAREPSASTQAPIRALLRFKWTIAAFVVLAAGASALYTSRLPKIYQASATALIDPRPPQVLGNQVQEIVQMGSGNVWADQEYYNTQVAEMKSKSFALHVARLNSFHDREDIVGDLAKPEDKRLERAAGVVRGAIQISPPKTNRVATITAKHTEPEVAAAIANAVVATYVQRMLDLRAEGTGVASEWLSEELDAAEKKLKATELAMLDFRRENEILALSLEDRKTLVYDNIAHFSTELNTARSERMKLSVRRERLTRLRDTDPLESPLLALFENEAAQTIKAEYYAAESKLLEMSAEFGEKHPLYAAQLKRLEKLREALKREVQVALGMVEERYQAAVETERAISGELERYKAMAFEIEPKAVVLNQLARQEAAAEAQYNLVMDRLRTSELTSRLKTVNIRSLDPAVVPTTPVSPRMSINVAVASLGALVLGCGLAMLIGFLDRTVKTVEDVEVGVGAPMLGVIPVVPEERVSTDPQARDLYVFEDARSPVAECCRSIRTNLMFMAADHDFKSMVVSSAKPREGKTTTVIYMATVMAQSGQRVLIVDSDMRRPRLHQSLGVSRSIGLSNLIVGDAEVDDAVKTTDIPNLYVLPCGPTPPNPAELLMTDSFKRVLKSLEDRFDLVLLDSPPLLAVTDAVVLSRLVDATVLVLRAGGTLKNDAAHAAKSLRDVKTRITGAILNQLDTQDRTYGYYYHYYSEGYGPDAAPRTAKNSA